MVIYIYSTTNEAVSLPSECNLYTNKVRERNCRTINKVQYRQWETEKSLKSIEKDIREVHHDLKTYIKELNHKVQCLKL